MRKIILAIALVAMFSTMKGQPWHPFPANQVSYYKHPVLDWESNEVLLVERYCNDSIWYESEQQYVHFFSGNFLREECYWQDYQLQFVCESSNLLDFGHYKADRFTNNDNSVLLPVYEYFSMDTLGTILFKPWAKVGESWMTNGRTIKCTVAGVTAILGVQDSVKYFDCELADYTKSTIILSKNHGLIKFSPFNLILNTNFEYISYIELIGYEKETQQAGYKLPGFSDYFNLSAGDILFWKDFAWVGNEGDNDCRTIYGTLFHKDSITSVEVKTDTIKYHYKRWCFDSEKNLIRIETAVDAFLKSNEGSLVDHQPGWFGLHEKVLWDDRSKVCAYPKTEIVINPDDTITKIICYIEPYTLSSYQCGIGQIMDMPRDVLYFSTKEGITRKTLTWKEECQSFNDTIVMSTELVGSIINMGKSGIVDFKSTSNREFSQPNLQLWPNPVDDILYVKNSGYNVSCIELFDMNGRLVKKAGNTQQLNIKELLSGIYMVKVWNDKSSYRTGRIIKR